MDTAKEIIDVVNKCYNNGVNDVYVAGLTARPQYEEKINQINKILKRNASLHNYEFIDNCDISVKHLRVDKLHLNHEGKILLANNFLKALNRRNIYDDYY